MEATNEFPSGKPPDEELLRRYLNSSDREALSVLFARHTPSAYRLARRFLQNQADAEDAVQTAFLRVYQCAGQFRGEASVKTWMLSFVASSCANKTREESRRSAREAAAIKNSVQPDAGVDEQHRAVKEAVEKLPHHLRVPLWLHYYEGLTSVEVAVVTGVAENTVRTHVRRGLEALRATLADQRCTVHSVALPALLASLPEESVPASLVASIAGLTKGGAVAATGQAGAGKLSGSTAVHSGFALKAAVSVVVLTAVVGGGMAQFNKKTPAGNSSPVAAAPTEPKDLKSDPESPSKGRSDKASLGSLDFYPSPEQPVGWRGDGTGRYPGATPPVTWARTKVGGNYAVKNIVWAAPLPNSSLSCPIIVGDRIFLTTEGSDIVCLDKKNGRILWIRSNPEFEALSEDERKGNAAYASKLAPLLPQLAKANADTVEKLNAHLATAATDAAHPSGSKAKVEIEGAIYNEQNAIDKKKFDHGPGQAQFGYAGATPVSDGKHICAYFATGVIACYDLDGNRKWIQHGAAGNNSEHGCFASPVLCENKLVVFGWDMRAYDVETGKLAWSSPVPHVANSYGSLFRLHVGTDLVAASQSGYFARVSDGKAIWGGPAFGDGCQTPIVEGGIIYATVAYPIATGKNVGLKAFKIPADVSGKLTLAYNIKSEWADNEMARKGDDFGRDSIGSTLFVDGLLYRLTEGGGLIVNDAATGEIVYRKVLAMNSKIAYWQWAGATASPTLAGKLIYLMDNQGTTIVIEPGKQYKEVAKNSLEEPTLPDGFGKTCQVQMLSTPIFEGTRMYYHTPGYLYCIEQCGPYVDKTTVTKERVVFSFKQTGGGLIAKDAANGVLQDVLITGTTGSTKPAKAKIDGDTIVVDIKDAAVPFGISYAPGTLMAKNGQPLPSFGWNGVRVLEYRKCFDHTIMLTSNLELNEYWNGTAAYAVAGATVTNARIDPSGKDVTRWEDWPLRTSRIDPSGKGVTLTTDKAWKAGDVITLTYPCFQVEQGEARRETSSFTVLEIKRAAARFVKVDETTAGTWKGIYGAEGAIVIGDEAAAAPKYAVVTPKNKVDCTWVGSTDEARALQKSGESKDRIAACWYNDKFDIDIELTDGKEHQVAIYCLGWDRRRAITVEARDTLTNALLDTQTVKELKNGKYLVWNLKGEVTLHLVSTGEGEATVSGMFFDAPVRTTN